MLTIGQKVVRKNRSIWLTGIVLREAFKPSYKEPMYEVEWEDYYVGIAWETSLLPIGDNITEDQKQAILDLLCSK